jgi:hypothetical protein
MAEARGGESDLDRWLAPCLEVLRHKKRRNLAPLYLRGLLGPGERKSRSCPGAWCKSADPRRGSSLIRRPRRAA